MRCKNCGQFMAKEYRGWYDKNGKFNSVKFVSYDNPDVCFDCDFWLKHIEHDKNPEEYYVPFIYKHEHYIADIDPAHKDSHFKGFGGAKFKIQFLNGRVLECDNVWYQGEIPQRFWKLMPDNVKELKRL